MKVFKIIGLLVFVAAIQGMLSGCGKNAEIERSRWVSTEKGYQERFYSATGSLKLSIDRDSDSIPNGDYVLYYPEGSEWIAVQLKDGLPSGNFSWFEKNGNAVITGIFKDGWRHGLWAYYSPNRNDSLILTQKESFMQGEYYGGQFLYSEEDKSGHYWLKYGDRVLSEVEFYRRGNYRIQGEVHFYDRWLLDENNQAAEMVFFVADIPGLDLELSIFVEDEEEPILHLLEPLKKFNQMWMFSGSQFKEIKTSELTVLNLVLSDSTGYFVHRDFVILPPGW